MITASQTGAGAEQWEDIPECSDCKGEAWQFAHVVAGCLNCSGCWEAWGTCERHARPEWHRTPVTHMIGGETIRGWLAER